MTRFVITATNSATLSKQLDRFNATVDEKDAIHCNWGREGKRGTWFAHSAWGHNLRTGLAFHDVVKYVQDEIDTCQSDPLDDFNYVGSRHHY